MADSNTTDFTFRHDRTGNMIIGKRGEAVCNIVNMLFNTIPGTDEYDSDKGLYIDQKQFQMYENNTRDTAYESRIMKQFSTYTDLVPVNVVAMYMNHSLYVYMKVRYQTQIYEIDVVSSNNTLTAMLHSNNE